MLTQSDYFLKLHSLHNIGIISLRRLRMAGLVA